MKARRPFPTKMLVALSMLLALDIVLTRLLSIQTPILRIGFAFLPIAVAGYLFGAVPAALMAAVADVLGWLLFPQGTYFPGFTLSALVTGGLYGLFLFRRPSWLRILVVSLLLTLVVDLAMNTVWLSMLYDKAVFVLLPARLLEKSIMLVVQVPMIWALVALLRRSGVTDRFQTAGSPSKQAAKD